jgi:acetoacetyl-CoA synthetase
VKSEVACSMIETLTPIWQRVLQQSSIGAEDNFFDLGGDSSLALELFAEIARVCGRELPPVVIYQAPTIADLAALLAEPVTPQFPALVELKPGTERIPVFLAHGLGGSVMDFFQPVKYIQTKHPIYGLQAKGIDGVEEPFDRIEDMARFYLDAIRELQPQGPYFLIGFSLGGLVALEMAQQLSANGEKVGLLAMLDAYPYIRFLPFGQRVRLMVRQARRGLSIFRYLRGESYQPPAGVSFSPVMQRVRNRAYLALAHYRPRYYAGKTKFVRAGISTGFPEDPVAAWAGLIDRLEVETVPGDHLGIITTHFGSLAATLSRYLREAFSNQ